MRESIRFLAALAIVAVSDYVVSLILPVPVGVVRAEPATIAVVTALVLTAGVGVASLEEQKKARKAQESLANERKAQLASEARQRDAAKTKAETTGQRVGRSSRSAFTDFSAVQKTSATGFNTGVGRGNLFGN